MLIKPSHSQSLTYACISALYVPGWQLKIFCHKCPEGAQLFDLAGLGSDPVDCDTVGVEG